MRDRRERRITWEADLVPVAARFSDDEAARPALLLVADDSIPVHLEVVAHPPADAEGVASVLERAVAAVAERDGAWPTELLVRDADVARLMVDGEAARGALIRPVDELPAIELIVAAMARDIPDMGVGPRVASPETWAGWGLPDADVAELFAAGAAFHRAAPWRTVANEQLVDATLESGRVWTACVLGNAGQEFGLALYERRGDFGAFLEAAADPGAPFAAAEGIILSLTYERRANLSPRMRREIDWKGWKLASRDACPVLFTVNTLGGGLTREQCADLTALLRAVPRFVAAQRDVLEGAREATLPVEWMDEATGARLRYDGHEGVVGESIWGPHDTLTPGLATGAGAEPGASLISFAGMDAAESEAVELAAARELEIVDRFVATLPTRGARRHGEHAALFVEFLAGAQAIPVRAVSEFDLRVFLFEWYPREVQASLADARKVHATLGRFFAYLAEHERIVCPWASAVFAERDEYQLRVEEFPGGSWWDEAVAEWRAELFDDLDERAMLLPDDLGDGVAWGETMGMTELALHQVAQRRWLVWRDEVIGAGMTSPPDVDDVLAPRLREWARTALPELGGRTPIRAIREERGGRG